MARQKDTPIEDFAPRDSERDAACDRLIRRYARREARWIVIPTLDGLRVEFFHRVPAREWEDAWPGEKHAIIWMGTTYVSPLVPKQFLRMCSYISTT